VAAARHHARRALSTLAPEPRDAAELMVSELATNSIKHAQSPFTLVIDRSPAMISVEVHDTGGGHPTLGSPQPWEPIGRGLYIVDLMSSAWGVIKSDHGKVVWFTLDTDPPAAGADAMAGGTGTRDAAHPPEPTSRWEQVPRGHEPQASARSPSPSARPAARHVATPSGFA
jgi:anti-sigma regulatory factor (Ser/Thr protein kinase)